MVIILAACTVLIWSSVVWIFLSKDDTDYARNHEINQQTSINYGKNVNSFMETHQRYVNSKGSQQLDSLDKQVITKTWANKNGNDNVFTIDELLATLEIK